MQSQSPAYTSNSFVNYLFSSSAVSNLFNYTYLSLIGLTVILSLAIPIDRAIPVLSVLVFVFGILVEGSMIGAIYFLFKTGIYPYVYVYD